MSALTQLTHDGPRPLVHRRLYYSAAHCLGSGCEVKAINTGLCCVLVVTDYSTVALWCVDGVRGGTAAGARATVNRGELPAACRSLA